MLSAAEIVELHEERTSAWHRLFATPVGGLTWDGTPVDGLTEDGLASSRPETETSLPVNGHATGDRPGAEHRNWIELVVRQHGANFELWHIEDEARMPGATEAELAGLKRRVDQTNQRRNDLSEEVDRTLLQWLELRELPESNAALHSESPGLMIDRLSILALKIYHTREEAERDDAPPGHTDRNLERLAILEEQRADLAMCLDSLWRETLAGTRRFKIYRQLKMYNDPTLNPAVYRKLVKEQAR